MKLKILKGFFRVETDNGFSSLIKAKNMHEAVLKVIGSPNALQYLTKILDEPHYCSYALEFPNDVFFNAKKIHYRAYTIQYRS